MLEDPERLEAEPEDPVMVRNPASAARNRSAKIAKKITIPSDGLHDESEPVERAMALILGILGN